MSHLVRFLIRHALIGSVIAIAFVSAVLVFDIGDLRTLATRSSSGPLALVALTFACSLTFASVQMGFAIMLLAKAPESGGGKRGRAPCEAMPLKPIRAPVRAD